MANILKSDARPSACSGTDAQALVDTSWNDSDGSSSNTGIPAGYVLREDGLYLQSEPDADGVTEVRLCSPLCVTARCRREDGNGWSRLVELTDPDGRQHAVLVEEIELDASAARALAPLRDRGLQLEPVEKAQALVVAFLKGSEPTRIVTLVDQLGWTSDRYEAFALGDGRMIGKADVRLDRETGSIAAAMRAEGSLEAWRESVAAACVGNPLMVFAVSLAFAGPLLAPLGRGGGGFHLRGQSSRGKTTLLGVAASVWGAPAFVHTWRATDNGLEGVAAACSSILLTLDEMGQVDARKAGDIAYMLANGIGKTRMTKTGGNRRTSRWNASVLSSGEISLEEHMRSVGKRTHGGQEVRLVDIAADGRSHGAFDDLHGEAGGAAFAKRLHDAVRFNHGTAGPAFVEKLIPFVHSEVLSSAMRGFSDAVLEGLDAPADGAVQRVLDRFALVALAGELATRWGLTGWDRQTASRAAKELFLEWFQARDIASHAERDAVVARTRAFLVKERHRFKSVGTPKSAVTVGWIDDDWVYITPDTWRALHGIDAWQDATQLLKEAGLLRTGKESKNQWRMPRSVPPRPRVYAVSTVLLINTVERLPAD